MILSEPTFLDLLFGKLSLSEWKYQFFMMSLGVILRVLYRFKNRETTNKPSFYYWFYNSKNISTILISLILSYLLIRLFGDYNEYLKSFLPKKINPSVYFIMTLLGFYQHKLMILLAKYTSKK